MTSVLKQVFNNLSTGISEFKNRYKLPTEFHDSDELKIMHISDTPESIYAHIYKMVNYSQPDIIIHTGDIVDNLKLEDQGERLFDVYREKASEFISNLEKLSDARIIYVPGNHDNLNIITNNINSSEVITEGSIIELNGIKVALAHYPEKISSEAEINLFGHRGKTSFSDLDQYLNGISNINFLLLPSKEIYKINYPWVVNQGRKYKNFNMI